MNLKSLDLLPKLDKEYRIGTPIGGILSILSLIATIFLFYSDFLSYLNPPVRQKFRVNTQRPTGPDGMTISSEYQPRLSVELDISLPSISCYLIHFDALESFTQSPLPLEDKSINFTRLKKNSEEVIGQFPRKFLKTKPVEGCGSCYQANVTKCCNTCHEVYKAYRLDGLPPPNLITISQCQSVVEMISKMKDEGCRVRASYNTIKFASEFHISPGLSSFTEGWHIHDLRPFGQNFQDQNLSHIIHKLHLSPTSEIMPLDNFTNIEYKVNKTWRAMYTINIIDTDYSASHYEVYNTTSPPGVVFKYDISPIRAVEYQERDPLISLLSSTMMMVGGVLLLFLMVDSAIFAKDPLNIFSDSIVVPNQ